MIVLYINGSKKPFSAVSIQPQGRPTRGEQSVWGNLAGGCRGVPKDAGAARGLQPLIDSGSGPAVRSEIVPEKLRAAGL
jgi:hypothetical protein